MKILHGSADTEDARPGITEAERAQHVATCRANVVESIAAVLEVGAPSPHTPPGHLPPLCRAGPVWASRYRSISARPARGSGRRWRV